MTSKLYRFIALALIALTLSACAGYQLGPVKPADMAGINTLYVPVFQNKTLEPRIETLVTNTVIGKIQADGTYRIARYDDADASLEAVIKEVARRPRRSIRGNVLATAEFQVDIEIAYRVVQRGTGKILMSGTVSGSTNFFVGDDIQQEEAQSIPVAAENAADNLVSAIGEGW